MIPTCLSSCVCPSLCQMLCFTSKTFSRFLVHTEINFLYLDPHSRCQLTLLLTFDPCHYSAPVLHQLYITCFWWPDCSRRDVCWSWSRKWPGQRSTSVCFTRRRIQLLKWMRRICSQGGDGDRRRFLRQKDGMVSLN